MERYIQKEANSPKEIVISFAINNSRVTCEEFTFRLKGPPRKWTFMINCKIGIRGRSTKAPSTQIRHVDPQ